MTIHVSRVGTVEQKDLQFVIQGKIIRFSVLLMFDKRETRIPRMNEIHPVRTVNCNC
jgi:hypothetical protein